MQADYKPFGKTRDRKPPHMILGMAVAGVALAACGAWFMLSRPDLDRARRLLDEGRTEQGVAMLASLASKNDVGAALLLGDLYWRDDAVPQNARTALPYLEQAALGGDVRANALLGEHYYGTGEDAGNRLKAAPYLQAAAEKGHAASAGLLGSMYYHGDGVGQNKPRAAKYLAVAAKNDSGASALYGAMLLRGDGVRRDYQQGVERLEAAAQTDDPDVQYVVGNAYLTAEIPEKALPHLIRAHAGGRTESGREIGGSWVSP